MTRTAGMRRDVAEAVAVLANLAGPEALSEVVRSLPSRQRPKSADVANWVKRRLRRPSGIVLISAVARRLSGGIACRNRLDFFRFRWARILYREIARSLGELRAIAERRTVERFSAWLGSHSSLSSLNVAFAFAGHMSDSFRPHHLPGTTVPATGRSSAREMAA